jgi:hypothetical protein
MLRLICEDQNFTKGRMPETIHECQAAKHMLLRLDQDQRHVGELKVHITTLSASTRRQAPSLIRLLNRTGSRREGTSK